MIGWYTNSKGHEFGSRALGNSEGQGNDCG